MPSAMRPPTTGMPTETDVIQSHPEGVRRRGTGTGEAERTAFDFESRHTKQDVYMQTFPLPKPDDDMPIVMRRR